MPFVAAFLAAFFTGAIPTAYLFVRLFKGADIRKYGSGNVGATNAARLLGKKMGALIFTIDFLKGFLPALILSRFTAPSFNLSLPELSLLIGLGAVFGHIFTPFLGGRGGKGIATGAGAIGAGFPLILAFMMTVWLLLMRVTRKTVSISSLGAVGSFVIFAVLFNCSGFTISYAVFLFILAVWTHRSNISRLKDKSDEHDN